MLCWNRYMEYDKVAIGSQHLHDRAARRYLVGLAHDIVSYCLGDSMMTKKNEISKP